MPEVIPFTICMFGSFACRRATPASSSRSDRMASVPCTGTRLRTGFPKGFQVPGFVSVCLWALNPHGLYVLIWHNHSCTVCTHVLKLMSRLPRVIEKLVPLGFSTLEPWER